MNVMYGHRNPGGLQKGQGFSLATLKRPSKSFQNPVLRAWLELFILNSKKLHYIIYSDIFFTSISQKGPAVDLMRLNTLP